MQNYPKTEKYISLLKQGEDEAVNKQRRDLRAKIRRMMEVGELAAEPESLLQPGDGERPRKAERRRKNTARK